MTTRTSTCLLALLAAPALAQDVDLAEKHRAEVAERYAFTTWSRSAARVGLANDLELAGFVATAFEADQGRIVRRFRRETVKEGTSFLLSTHVADTPAQAHQALLTWLAGLQSPQRMPDLASIGAPLGDVGFFGRSGAAQGAQAWVAFVRGNVVVRLNAFDAREDPGLDLLGPAREIDFALLEAEVVPEGAALPRPAVELRIVRPVQVVAGARLRLDVDVQDPHDGEVHLGWTVAGSGLGYVELAADGRPFLHTTGPGELELILEVTGSTGTFVRSAVKVDVLDD